MLGERHGLLLLILAGSSLSFGRRDLVVLGGCDFVVGI